MSAVALRYRPIYGGVFGNGKYSLASMPCVAAGLHAVRYLVIEPRWSSWRRGEAYGQGPRST